MTTSHTSAFAAHTLPGYTLTRAVAEGGMAEVFIAVQHSLGREVAVKIMKQGETSLAERFQREARLVATLNHSHIVPVYDVGQLADGRPYLSMELLPGGDLRQRIRDGLRGKEVLRIMRQMAEGLQCIHERGIIHRDIKPANILFRNNGDAVLTDFGIAKSADIDCELTHAGTVVGSPAYSSPEQISSKPLDARSDLYSLGVVLVEMLIGRNPFRGGDYATTVLNQLQESPPMLPPWHAMWQPVVDRLLAKKPEHRYASAAALLADLGVLNVEPTQLAVDMDSTTTRFHTAMRPVLPVPAVRRRRLRLAAVAALLLMLVMGGLGWWSLRPDPRIEEWLARAGERLQQDRLTEPAGDSAEFYFQQVRALAPEHPEVAKGLALVARRHSELARQAHARDDLEGALAHVRSGLRVAPDDPALQLLRDEIPVAMARRHAEQALKARVAGDLEAARQHVDEGLAAHPEDAALLAMREEIAAAIRSREAEKARALQRSRVAKKTSPAPAAEKRGFFSRLFGGS